jgi:hypothetical protein
MGIIVEYKVIRVNKVRAATYRSDKGRKKWEENVKEKQKKRA